MSPELVHEVEVIILVLLSIGGFVIQRFLQYLFREIETSRKNERELFQRLASTREDILQAEIRSLERELSHRRRS